jgi:hypothetical protein
MPRRPDGFDATDFDEGVRLVFGDDDLRAALEEYPVLASPILHSRLRAAVQETRDAGSAERCDTLVRILHERAYRATVLAAIGGDPQRSAQSAPEISAYFLYLLQALAGKVPPAGTGPLDPARDAATIRDQLVVLTGDASPTLPDYEPSERGRWLSAVMECMGTGWRRSHYGPRHAAHHRSTALSPRRA